MAYSLDFRKQVFKVKKEKNFIYEETSDHFGITIRSLFRWSNRLEPKLKREKPATKVDMKGLEKDVKKIPILINTKGQKNLVLLKVLFIMP